MKLANWLTDRSIGTKIKWLIFPIAIIPLVALSLIILSVSKQALIKQVDDNTKTKLLDISSQIQSTYALSVSSLVGELNAFEYLLTQSGTLEIVNNQLLLVSENDSIVINSNNHFVDKFSNMFGNPATIFQVTGNEAIRVSTNIRTSTGELAIGTTISQAVFNNVINKKEKYIGFADVVGTPYMTVYSPLLNSAGEVVAIIFVGIKEIDLFQQLISRLSQLTLGESGQIYIIDEHGNWIIKPNLTISNQYSSEKEKLTERFSEENLRVDQPYMIELTESGKRLKLWHLQVPELNWTIKAYVYPNEFMQPLNQTKNSIIAVVLILIVLITFITHVIGTRISKKAKSLSNLAKPVKENNLTYAKALSSKLANTNFKNDEFQIIANALDDAIHAVNKNHAQVVELKERYRQFFDVNTSVKLVIEPETGSIVEANSAALTFYGYDLKTITSMNISDINNLSKQQIIKERDAAVKEERLYFEFKHKLASGELRDVEVYSGPVEINGKKLLLSIVHDVTQRKLQALELEKERFRLSSIVEGTNAAIWEWNDELQTVNLNEKWLGLLGYDLLPSQTITTSAWRSRIHVKDLAQFEDELCKNINGQSTKFSLTLRHISVSGQTLWIKHSGRFMTTSTETERVLYCASVDVTELKEKEQQAIQSLEKFEAIANSTMAGVLSLDKQRNVTYVNEQFYNILGYRLDSLENLDYWVTVATTNDKDSALLSNLLKKGTLEHTFEISLRCKDGSLKDIMLSIVKSPHSVVATFVDITEQKKREHTIEYIANHDTLTGLSNRAAFNKYLNFELNKAANNKTQICILFIDLDGFKQINDNHGHDAGDKVLQIVASRMSAEVRVERGLDVVSRLGGDEFTIMLTNVFNVRYCEQIIERILTAIRQPVRFNNSDLRVTSSIGAVLVKPNSGFTTDAILRQADHAMYLAKNSGKNKFAWFEKPCDTKQNIDNITPIIFNKTNK